MTKQALPIEPNEPKGNVRRTPIAVVLFAVAFIFVTLVRTNKRMRVPSASSSSSENGTLAVLYQDSSDSNSSQDNWSEFSNLLCPNYIPQVEKYADLLFELAGQAIHDDNDNETYSAAITAAEHEKKNQKDNKQRIRQFFKGPFDRGTKLCRVPDSEDFILYMRIYKCANNQIMEWMNDALDCYSKTDLEGSMKQQQLLLDGNTSSLQPKKNLCIITAIRDPISHWLSAYNEIEYQWLANHSNFANVKVKQKLVQEGNLHYIRQNVGSKERFQSFVRDFLERPKGMKQGVFDHLDSMSRILTTLETQQLSLSAYLPSLHNLSYSWPDFVSQTCLSSNTNKNDQTSLERMDLSAQHDSSSDPYQTYQAAKGVWNDEGPIATALCILHAMDYACWKQLPEGIPKFCRNVYSGKAFQDMMLNNKE